MADPRHHDAPASLTRRELLAVFSGLVTGKTAPEPGFGGRHGGGHPENVGGVAGSDASLVSKA